MDFKAETMSQANIASIHGWLASELELHKIDAVIYTRHVLDIFLNSSHTTDLHLAKKEESIFAKLPGSKERKPKQKYSKRANSFHTSDEVFLKKEMAVKCLLSAVDRNHDEVPNDSAIKNLIQKLYSKLVELSIVNDGKASSSSDEDHVAKKQRPTSLPSQEKEQYHVAFPQLLASCDKPSFNPDQTQTAWGGKKPVTPSLSPTENEVTSKVGKKLVDTTFTSTKSQTRHQKTDRKRSKPSYSLDEKNPTKTGQHKIKQHQPNKKIATNQGTKRDFPSLNSKNSRNSQWKHHARFDKKCRSHPFDRKTHSKSDQKRAPGFKSSKVSKSQSCSKINEKKKDDITSSSFQQICYSPYPASCFSEEFVNLQSAWQPHSNAAAQSTSASDRPKLLSKWFRDPKSGFLEFDPGTKTSQSSSDDQFSCDEVFIDEESGITSESWLWCPSPSLWADEPSSPQGGAVSRLETTYRAPTNKQQEEDAEADQLWEDYKAIFTEIESDLQKCTLEKCEVNCDDDTESDDEDLSDKGLTFPVQSILNSVWAEESSLLCDVDDAGDLNGNYLPQAWSENDSSDKDCIDSNCLSCSAFRKMKDQPVRFFGSELDMSLLGQLRHSALDEEKLLGLLDIYPQLSQLEASRSQIWLQNSFDFDNHQPLPEESSFGFGKTENCVDMSIGSRFQGFFNKSYLMDDFFTDVKSTFLGSSNLQWLNWSYINPFMDLDQLLSFQSLSGISDEDHFEGCSSDEEEDGCFLATLVQSVLEVVTDPEELNPLLLDLPDPPSELEADSDYVVPHPEDQISPPMLHQTHAEKVKGLEDCVTDNDAWKTSLRIGNMWQAIAGIRPVDIVYSEKQASSEPCVLKPSSLTHFRPIHMSEMLDLESPQQFAATQETQAYTFSTGASGSPTKNTSSEVMADTMGDVQLKRIEIEIGKLLFDTQPVDAEPTLCGSPKFEKIRQDKCQQTTFEQQIKWIDKNLRKELASRPPKANSR